MLTQSESANAFSKNRTFFCSELVAKAFKSMQIIENDNMSCSMYFPSHFTSSGDHFLKLKADVTIDKEHVVMTNDEWTSQMTEPDLLEHQRLNRQSCVKSYDGHID